MHTLECQLLKLQDDPNLHPDDWPEFPLINVEAVDTDSGELADLLLINEAFPVTVTGRLGSLAKEQYERRMSLISSMSSVHYSD